MGSLATKLSEALSGETLEAQYARAVAECDDAWDAVEGFLSSGFRVCAAEAHAEFRKLYFRKVSIHRLISKAA